LGEQVTDNLLALFLFIFSKFCRKARQAFSGKSKGVNEMKIYLRPSLVLTDEHPSTAKGTPVLVDSEIWDVYKSEDMIEGIPAKQVVSSAVAEIGENNFLPEEICFISRFTKGDHESQSGHGVRKGKMKKLTYEETEFLKRA
jgi:hypothetical protein